MILACQNITKSFGTNEILKNASFHIEDREKTAIVGINGAGKSTLLKIIMRQISADSGEVMIAKGKTIGYLAQHEAVSSGNTIYQELLEVKRDLIKLEENIRQMEHEMKSLQGDALTLLLESYNRMSTEFERRDGYSYRSELAGVLKGLGFDEEDFGKKVETLSGGQKTRVALGKLLLSKPDIILLDEPTNHLDVDAKAELKRALQEYKGSILLICHEPEFYQDVVTKVWNCQEWSLKL